VNETLLKVAGMQVKGVSLQGIAEELGVSVEWVMQVTGTNGYLVVKEAVVEGRV
jgi:orotate phosphoribosyltransferase-like protein